MAYTTVQRREIYEGRVLHVVVDDVRDGGGTTHTRELVLHPGAAAIVPVLADGRVILIKQYRHATGGDIWEIPAGTLEPPESPEACAARELTEETGYRADRLTPLGEFYTAPGFCSERMHLFLATELRAGDQRLDHDERITVHAAAPDEVAAMVADGRIADAKTLVGWYRYQAWCAAQED